MVLVDKHFRVPRILLANRVKFNCEIFLIKIQFLFIYLYTSFKCYQYIDIPIVYFNLAIK